MRILILSCVTRESMSPGKRWGCILSSIVLISGLFLLFIPLDVQGLGRSLAALWNLGHLLFFFCLTWMLLPRIKWKGIQAPAGVGIGLAMVCGLVLGGLIEFLQHGIDGRSAGVGDIYLDITGAMLASVWTEWRPGMTLFPYAATLRVVSIMVAAPLFFPLLAALADEWRARRDFPVLVDSTSCMALSRFSDQKNLQWLGDSIRIDFTTTRYSGFGLRFFPRGWTGYARLEMSLSNPSDRTITLTCRIHDRSHNQAYEDRFNAMYAIVPGENTIVMNLAEVSALPTGRLMDMTNIAGIGCFTTSLERPVALLLHRIGLAADPMRH